MLCCCCYFRLEEIAKQLQEDIEREDNASDGEKEDNANGDDLLEEHRSLQLQSNLDLCFSNLFFPNLSLFPTIVNMFNENYIKIFWGWVDFFGYSIHVF